MSSFDFEIVTMDSSFLKCDAWEIVVPAHDGYIGILPGHISFITILIKGRVKLKYNKKDIEFKSYDITGGFIEVTGKSVTLFADQISNI
jgi:F-type H+-transporting ATPase subunit epsilon